MTIRRILASAIAVATALSLAAPLHAETRSQAMRRKEVFTDQDAEKGQVHVTAAMTVPMETLLTKADIQHPQNMLHTASAFTLAARRRPPPCPGAKRKS